MGRIEKSQDASMTPDRMYSTVQHVIIATSKQLYYKKAKF